MHNSKLPELTAAKAEGVYGKVIDLGACLPTQNLNLHTLRGAAQLDPLALVSAPDVFDAVSNVHGSQRPLDAARTAALLRYAKGLDVEGASIEGPRAFPEILLNVREQSCIQLYDFEHPERMLSFNSQNGFAGKHTARVVGVRVLLDKLQFPKPSKNPQISRFDGNHRLAGTDGEVARSVAEGKTPFDLPSAPFALFIGLSPDDEMRLFNTINSKQKPVEPALLETQRYAMMSDAERLKSTNIPSYIAHLMAEDAAGAFTGVVDPGGLKEGAKKSGIRYFLKINGLKTTVQAQLRALPVQYKTLQAEPEHLFWHINNYWLAVRAVFPKEWQDKDKYVLLQTIGLTAMAQYWGAIIDAVIRTSVDKGTVEDYVPLLMPVAEKDLLRKSLYPGVAGAKGGDTVFALINKNVTDVDRDLAASRAKWKPHSGAADLLTGPAQGEEG